MASFLRVHRIDFAQVRAALGSGEEALCTRVLRTIPQAGADLIKDWKRGVTALLLGDRGELLSGRDPLISSEIERPGPALSLAFASVLQELVQDPPGVRAFLERPEGGGFWASLRRQHPALFSRPLFGLESGHESIRWGGWGRADVAALASSLVDPAAAELRDVVQAATKDDLDLVSFTG